MEQLYIELKKATHQRLLGINDDIRCNRKQNKTIANLVSYRKTTNTLLNKISISIAKKSFSKEQYSDYKQQFLNPSLGEKI